MTVPLSEPGNSSTKFIAVDQYATFGGMVFEFNSLFVTETDQAATNARARAVRTAVVSVSMS